jgi:hypothetical protein
LCGARKFFGSRRFLGFGYFSRQGAKTLSSEEKNDRSQTNSLPLIRALRLGVPSTLLRTCFAGDIPRLTGARSAPYENLRVLRAFVVKNPFLLGVLCAFAGDIPSFGCGFAALGLRGENIFTVNPEEPPFNGQNALGRWLSASRLVFEPMQSIAH